MHRGGLREGTGRDRGGLGLHGRQGEEPELRAGLDWPHRPHRGRAGDRPGQGQLRPALDTFWLNHDPTVKDRQFCDAGSQYRPEVFYHSEEQKRLAEASKAKWEKAKPFRQPILTPVTQASEFYPTEDYHQDYYKKNPVQYRFYVTGCGRYARLDQLWGALRKQ